MKDNEIYQTALELIKEEINCTYEYSETDLEKTIGYIAGIVDMTNEILSKENDNND